MSRHSRTWVISATVAAGGLLIVSVITSALVGWSWSEYVSSYGFTNVVVGAALAASGLMIAWHRPDNAVGVVFSVAGLGHLASAATGPLGLFAAEHGWPEPIVRSLTTVFLVGWTMGLPTLFLLGLLLFPDGHLPSPRWRWVAWLILGFTAWGVITTALTPNTIVPGVAGSRSILAWPDLPTAVIDVVTTVMSAAIVVPVLVSLVVRYVRGDERTRRQLLWLMLAVLAIVVLNAQRWVTGDGPILFLLSATLVPAAIAIAILRYRLLDIRLVLSRTLLYGVLIALVIALYAGIVAGLTAVVPGDADRVVAIGAAVVVALAFNPLRILLQRAISRAFFGTRSDPAATVRQVSASLGAASDLTEVLRTLRLTLRIPRLVILDQENQVVAADGDEPDPARHEMLALSSGGAQLGNLDVSLRAGERGLHAADHRALAAVLPLLGLLLSDRALAAELRQARAQTVEARERERQVLHRDLHDGLGPALTGAVMRMDAARNVVITDPAGAQALLSSARADTAAALDELRRVVYGLRPLALDERGLIGALREQETSGTPPEVRICASGPLPDLSPALEVAAYRVVLEGIANARRHSNGSLITVTLGVYDGTLDVLVHDDGDPPERFSQGVGIRSILERADELGGTAKVGPVADGWLVSAKLPVRA